MAKPNKEQSPSLSPSPSSPRSTASSPNRLSVLFNSNVHPGNFPFPSAESGLGIPLFLHMGSSVSDVTRHFGPSIADTASATPKGQTYNTWSSPRDFPSPNIYDLTLKMNADIGMESFWENIIEIFVTNFYASRVSLSIPYDLTDITNTPWGLKATYNGSIDSQQTRIYLERQQSQGASSLPTEPESELNLDTENDTPKRRAPPAQTGVKPVAASFEEQLNKLPSADHQAKVHANLRPLDTEDEPLIDNMGISRVLDRGSIVVLSREYRDPEHMKCHEEEVLKTHQSELKEESGNVSGKRKSKSVRNDVLAAWERAYFKPPERHQTPWYEEHDQYLASPWSQSPVPSPAILKESSEAPFFDKVESAFSPNEESNYACSDVVYAIGMENCRSIIHIPLVHPQTSKSISSEGESSDSSGHPRIVPIAIISFLSTITPYPQHLITTLSAFAPLIATSLSQAIRYSNVLHQLTHSPASLRDVRSHSEEITSTDRHYQRSSPGESTVTQSPVTSETSTPSWELQGHLFSPAIVEAETPSPFRSSLSIDTDYFSFRSHTAPPRPSSLSSISLGSQAHLGSIDDFRPTSSKSSTTQDTAPLEQDKPYLGKLVTNAKVRRRSRRAFRMLHSHGATSQFPRNLLKTPRKGNSIRRTDSFLETSDC